MYLILISLLMSFLGMVIGANTGGDIAAVVFGIFGALTPALFTIQRIYSRLEELESKLK